MALAAERRERRYRMEFDHFMVFERSAELCSMSNKERKVGSFKEV